MTSGIDDWLTLFEKLIPPDGRLTKKVIESVGDLPIDFHPSSELNAEEIHILRRGAQAEAKAYASAAAQSKSTAALGRASMWRSMNATSKQEKEWAVSDYWLAAKTWIDETY